jgi:hypothetical protein
MVVRKVPTGQERRAPALHRNPHDAFPYRGDFNPPTSITCYLQVEEPPAQVGTKPLPIAPAVAPEALAVRAANVD